MSWAVDWDGVAIQRPAFVAALSSAPIPSSMSTHNQSYPTAAPTIRHISTVPIGPLPLAPLKLGLADFAQLAAWLCEPATHHKVDPRAVQCRWGKSCGKTLNLSSSHKADVIRHLKYEHPDGPLRSGDYRNLACKWVGCGMHANVDFKNNAQAEDWIREHMLEHTGVRAAEEGRKVQRCVLCKKLVDRYRSPEEHMRKCIQDTPFLDTARDLQTYGVRVCAFNEGGEWAQVRVAAAGMKDLLWVKCADGEWVGPLSGRSE
ncbi:hypothetical protein PENSPDRAFT_50606 [Peniophora sp. CONT]|nr:hypothetical protein PENSPDRAFT_50606 [Peniophora sp. CONT]